MKTQGSYTVEAALIVPIVLVCLMFIIDQAITLYLEVIEDTIYSNWWQTFESADSFRKGEFLKNMIESIREK